MTDTSCQTPVCEPPLISLLLPTRKRPALANRFFESVVKHSRFLDKIEIVLYIDEDDHGSHDLWHPNIRLKKIIGPGRTMGGYNTECLKRSIGEIIILVNDDVVIQTTGWDERIRMAHGQFSDEIYLAYSNDFFKRKKICTFPILSRKTCELLKHPYPENYLGAFIDTHIFDLFKRLKHIGHDRILYLEDVVFEHYHYRNGKSPLDETYSKRGRFDDDATFLALREMRNVSAKKLAFKIQKKEQSFDLPVDPSPIETGKLLPTLLNYTKEILFDRNLPLGWRIWLWAHFYGRFLAARGVLGKFLHISKKAKS